MAASMIDVMKYFELKAAPFRAEWNLLTEADKVQLKDGVGNGTLTYA
jgi:hypothetical protein